MTQALAILLACGVASLCFMALRRSEWALLLVMTLYSFEQILQSYFPFLIARSWLTNVGVAVLAGAAIFSRFTRGESVFAGYPNKALWALLGLYAFEYVALAWAPEPGATIGIMKSGFPYLILMLGLAPLLVKDVEHFNRLLIAMLIVGTGFCFLIIFNPKAGFGGSRFTISLGTEAGEKRASPLAIATLGGMVAVAAALIKFKGAGRLLLILRIAGFAGGLGLAILSGSRGQVLGAIITVVMFYPMARKVKNVQQFFTMVVGIAVLLVAIYGVWQLFVGAENEARWTSEKLMEGGEKRFDKVWDIFSVFMVSPHMWLTGLGPGAYTSITGLGYTHNVLVEITCELGLIGLSLYAVILWTTYRQGRNVFEAYRTDSVRRATVTVMLAIAFYQFFLSLKQGSIIGTPGPMMYFLLMSKIAVTEQQQWEEEGFPELDVDPEDEWADADEYLDESADPYDLVSPGSAADYGNEWDDGTEYGDPSLGYT